MHIDKTKDYVIDNYRYRNFVKLAMEEKLMILKERNHPDVKKWMFTDEDIQQEVHLKFVDSLNDRNDSFYWLVERNSVPVGVVSLVKCDYEREEGEPGYYLFAEYQDSGIGLEFQYAYKNLFFREFGLNRLPGHIQYGNTSAYLMTAFLGGEEDGIVQINDVKYLEMHTPKSRFLDVGSDKLASRFVKYIKTHKKVWD